MLQLNDFTVSCWDDISAALDRIQQPHHELPPTVSEDAMRRFSQGVAFITFNYGIDGVSIEMAKYAQSLADLFSAAADTASAHFIGGNFFAEADTVLRPHWKRLKLPGFDGWDKWEGGKWFNQLFLSDMPEGSAVSEAVAAEIWRQAIGHAEAICDYLKANGISLMVPVNVNSNPGNPAATLAVILASELSGAWVINSNHDFYWEGGTPAAERSPDEPPGVRDHFFRNCANRPFFALFKRIYPWNGARWLQVNINTRQSDHLVDKYGFARERVAEIGTSIDDAFFAPYSEEEKLLKRLRMAYILSDGEPRIRPVPVDAHLAGLATWMRNQAPVVCGARSGLELYTAQSAAVYLLQPTRVIGRKRIERDWQFIGRLLQHPPFRKEFESDPDSTLTLHITGPVPIEHQADLEKVLNAYKDVLSTVPELADRLFTAFSVGNEDHPALARNGLDRLHIQDIYMLADIVLFPSETEGRGLPLPESGAAGVPIVSSRYTPEAVFAEVVGEGLPEEQQLKYTLFPEDEFGPDTLDEITSLLFSPALHNERKAHNRRAVAARYGIAAMKNAFSDFLQRLAD